MTNGWQKFKNKDQTPNPQEHHYSAIELPAPSVWALPTKARSNDMTTAKATFVLDAVQRVAIANVLAISES